MLNFFTGYYENGIVIMDLKMICSNYLRSFFWIDVVSSFPVSIISILYTNSSALQSSKFFRVIRITKYLRLIRLFRIIQMSKIIQAFEILIVSE